jgi:uncharacterized protein YhhL (DUF1145 family)
MPKDSATASVEEILKTLIATSGVMLALLWGLLPEKLPPPAARGIIRHASVIFVVTVIAALLDLQLIVSATQKGTAQPAAEKRVGFLFLVAWVAFIAGCIYLIRAIYSGV